MSALTLALVAGAIGGLGVVVFIGAIGGIQVTRAGGEPTCTRHGCASLRHAACGAGHCAPHCHLYCTPVGADGPRCIDPRPAPTGKPGYRPTVIAGGKV